MSNIERRLSAVETAVNSDPDAADLARDEAAALRRAEALLSVAETEEEIQKATAAIEHVKSGAYRAAWVAPAKRGQEMLDDRARVMKVRMLSELYPALAALEKGARSK